MPTAPSLRADIIERRTYLRPHDDGTFETHEEGISRVIDHQRWLWERAKGGMKHVGDEWNMVPLDLAEEAELSELKDLMIDRKVAASGRTRWLGGTQVARTREASQFNCSGQLVNTVHDLVDNFWLLLQGCGVGFNPVMGTLNGFVHVIEDIEIIRSTRVVGDGGGQNGNVETFEDGIWTIKIGDSAEAWAKALGKLVAGKYPAEKLVLDLTAIRAAGQRLKGYGWICSGDEQLAEALVGICEVMNSRAGQLVDIIDILDIVTWLGTTLSSRRAALLAMLDKANVQWKDFVTAKEGITSEHNRQRYQSNNSLIFYNKPTKRELKQIFNMMKKAGGSEPGFINGEHAVKRAPWFKTVNPCAEILLGDKSFCNLVETVLFRFNGDEEGLHRAHWLIARANYRQTCVNLDDGILQRAWHELNEFLRLCGVSVTGVVSWEFQNEPTAWQDLRECAIDGIDSMADELGMPRSKLGTTLKPSGTNAKVSSTIEQECSEGIHRPLGRFIFNNVGFGNHDPLVAKMRKANYHMWTNPADKSSTLVRFPVEYKNIEFDKVMMDGREVEVNLETAVAQLDRYKMVMDNYVDHNCSITISYDLDEVDDIIDWLVANWDSYVGVSFIYRNDPTKTAEDLGFAYLPQQVVDEKTYHDYVKTLGEVNLVSSDDTFDEIDTGDECSTGSCPIR